MTPQLPPIINADSEACGMHSGVDSHASEATCHILLPHNTHMIRHSVQARAAAKTAIQFDLLSDQGASLLPRSRSQHAPGRCKITHVIFIATHLCNGCVFVGGGLHQTLLQSCHPAHHKNTHTHVYIHNKLKLYTRTQKCTCIHNELAWWAKQINAAMQHSI